MTDWRLETPVAFLIFNRPDTTRRVFERIRAARPPVLLVVADGPRADRAGEAERCAATRAVLEGVDWPCRLLTEFSEVNLGCRERVASGLDWVFREVEEAIVLEDDCLPEPSFFRFCAELLARYRSDTRIGMIAGTNLQAGACRGAASYYYSKYTSIWGWASWRRAWAHYDRSASVWPEFRDSGALEAVTEPAERIYWQRAFEGVFRGRIDTWDYQWTLSCWSQGLLAVVPNENLISNLGFGPEATHTKGEGPYANLPTRALEFPLTHPRLLVADQQADEFQAASGFHEPLRSRVRRYLEGALRA
jgi:hypothetical protein